MLQELPDELLLVFGEFVCQSSLAVLCRVSKDFNELFTPLLYRNIQMDNVPVDLFKKIFQGLHVRHIRHLGLTSSPSYRYENERKPTLDGMLSSIQNLKSLKSFDAGEFFSLRRKEEDHITNYTRLLQQLAGLGTIRDLSLDISSSHISHEFPGYSNTDEAIAEVLLSSPDLTHLCLRTDESYGEDVPSALMCLIKIYEKKRKQRSLSPLKLTHLQLENGYLPCPGLHKRHGYSVDYLSHLTDLTTLRSLGLVDDDVTDMFNELDHGVDPQVFANAIQLHRLTIGSYTEEIEQLVELPHLKDTLSEIEISQYYDEEGCEDQITAVFRTTRPSVKKLVLGGGVSKCPGEAVNIIKETVLKMPQLEMFATPITRRSYDMVIQQVLLKMQNLTSLFLLGEVASIINRRRLSEKNEESRCAKEAKRIFNINRILVFRKEFRPLRVVGVGTHIFVCHLLSPHFDEKSQEDVFSVKKAETLTLAWYKVVKLSQTETLAFKSIIELSRRCR
ncbi:hypothetical protein AWENTII_008313 [Aspergillus wentii]